MKQMKGGGRRKEAKGKPLRACKPSPCAHLFLDEVDESARSGYHDFTAVVECFHLLISAPLSNKPRKGKRQTTSARAAATHRQRGKKKRKKEEEEEEEGQYTHMHTQRHKRAQGTRRTPP